MKLAEKIMAMRKQRGWSQEELAQQLSVSRQSVSKWESGASVPDLDKILKMSEIFDVSTDALLKEEMDLNERNTVFEDLQNERMKMRRIMFPCRKQRIILNGQSTKLRGSH